MSAENERANRLLDQRKRIVDLIQNGRRRALDPANTLSAILVDLPLSDVAIAHRLRIESRMLYGDVTPSQVARIRAEMASDALTPPAEAAS